MVVTGIGQCSWDFLATVDTYPPADSKQEVLHWEEQGGGPVATALVALSRLGVRSTFHGVVGDDELGVRIRRSLDKEGIDCRGLVTRSGAVSQRAFIVVEQGSASRTIFWQRPTGEPLSQGELSSHYLDGSSFLLLDGLMVEVSLAAAGDARQRGIPVMLDAGRLRPGMADLARSCDYVVAGEQFAFDLGWDGGDGTFAGFARSIGAPVVTVTRGTEGSLTWWKEGVLRQPAFPVAAVDTTGAGDVFHGGYLFGLLQGWELSTVLPFASAMAALKCTRSGGRGGIPDLQRVADFLQGNGIVLPRRKDR
ncbi:PfkB family carbohydrate kinase [Geomobilimonas luticola]|uniref:Sugar kinase n=1 Tax=Geomobilimonas luticola TaxID=1114878 RepID=A0ABS5SH45_9BACT|nr:PfkB family carbohydrate kinase [Geomobilimonas luticola]MBT0653896.1 sugar kinase [Geomobilimonas luticola]